MIAGIDIATVAAPWFFVYPFAGLEQRGTRPPSGVGSAPSSVVNDLSDGAGRAAAAVRV